MPALSQNLTFYQIQTASTSTSVNINYPNTGTGVITYVSTKVKGDGYYGSSDGIHTVAYSATRFFAGTITMQASLASEPVETDWFTVRDTTTTYATSNLRSTSTVDIHNFSGNFVWVRGHVQISEGGVLSIQYNN
jgi:hypothetical protein